MRRSRCSTSARTRLDHRYWKPGLGGRTPRTQSQTAYLAGWCEVDCSTHGPPCPRYTPSRGPSVGSLAYRNLVALPQKSTTAVASKPRHVRDAETATEARPHQAAPTVEVDRCQTAVLDVTESSMAYGAELLLEKPGTVKWKLSYFLIASSSLSIMI
jgi:hypothetical protein